MNLREEITRILDAFARQELGNRLSEFALIALKGMITQKVEEYELLQKNNDPAVRRDKPTGPTAPDS